MLYFHVRFPWNGQLMSTCEAELQELMKQIDLMVQNKKLEWERDLHSAETKLQLKDRECTMQRATVEQKSREVGQTYIRNVILGAVDK